MAEKTKQTIILDHKQIGQKITRIAHEILENNFQEKSIVIIGIKKEGFVVATRIFKILQEISTSQIELHGIQLDKKNPLKSNLSDTISPLHLKNKIVILVDDVLNSGRTLIHATQALLEAEVKGLQTVCLVDRKHRKFPIRADYVGLTLSTTLQEHITVEFSKTDLVYLE